MRTFFKMIRWPNLVIIVLSMALLLFVLITPGLSLEYNAGMNLSEFVLLIVAVLLTAMGGYVINDLKDVETDAINKPGKNIFENICTLKQGKVFYWIFTLGGVLAGTWLSFLLGKGSYSLVFVLTAGLLWFYAARYKCQPLMGNIVVAFLSALSFGLVWLYELTALQMHTVQVNHSALLMINVLVLIYMGFAFLVSLLREVVKDIEDIEGDEKTGCLTFAVAYGISKAKFLSIAVTFIGLTASIWLQWFFMNNGMPVLFWFFMIVDIIFIFVGIKLLRADNKADYSHLSFWIKILMLTGILSMGLFYFG